MEVLIAMILFSLCSPTLFQSLSISRRQIQEVKIALNTRKTSSHSLSRYIESLCLQDEINELLQRHHIDREDSNYYIETTVEEEPKTQNLPFPLLLKISLRKKEGSNFNPLVFWHTVYVEQAE